MGDFIYSFVSIASRYKNDVTALKGMRLLADVVHSHGVPITWLVSPESARAAAQELTRWHHEHGDDVAVAPQELSITTVDTSQAYTARRDRLARLRDEVRQALPWAECLVASGHTDPDIVRMCEEIGIQGMWGLCWEQIDVDDITDRGCPWGSYYMNPNDRLRPADGRSLLSFEWTARDLLKSFHSGYASMYSTDPNDVARSGICSWEDIAYWKGLADNYIRNTRYNQHVFMVQQQESHEMEIADGWRCYTEEDIREAAIMLDGFIGYIRSRAVVKTLPEVVRLYRDSYDSTPASYMLWEDTPLPRRPNSDYNWSSCVGPFPKTFLFCDRDAQMMFVDGKVEPVCLRNYDRPWSYGEFYAEPVIPRVSLVRESKFTWRREIELYVNAPKAMPYGIVLWNDYSLYQIGNAPDLIEGKILPHELMFLRYDLKAGENRFFIELTGK